MTFEEWADQFSWEGHSGYYLAQSAWETATRVERERAAALVEGNYGWRTDMNNEKGDSLAYCDNLADAIRSSGEAQ